MKKTVLTLISVVVLTTLTACAVPQAPLPSGEKVPVNTLSLPSENK